MLLLPPSSTFSFVMTTAAGDVIEVKDDQPVRQRHIRLSRLPNHVVDPTSNNDRFLETTDTRCNTLTYDIVYSSSDGEETGVLRGVPQEDHESTERHAIDLVAGDGQNQPITNSFKAWLMPVLKPLDELWQALFWYF